MPELIPIHFKIDPDENLFHKKFVPVVERSLSQYTKKQLSCLVGVNGLIAPLLV